MNTPSSFTPARWSVPLVLVLLAGAANARYLCDAPPTPVDRRACEAARTSPQALNHYVYRMNWLRHSLSFGDYVNEATQATWDRQRAAQQATLTASTSPAATP